MEFAHESEFESRAKKISVPDPRSPWFPLVNDFALTFNAYERVGEIDQIATVAESVDQAAQQNGLAPFSVEDLRTTLFFYQRRAHHNDSVPPHEITAAILAELVAKTGGSVAGPGDELP